MIGWIAFALVSSVVGAVLTIAWWRVGDQWADEEHKRFHAGWGDQPEPGQVIKGFRTDPDQSAEANTNIDA